VTDDTAFIDAVAGEATRLHDLYGDGQHEVIAELRKREGDLLRARTLAILGRRWDSAIRCMQGLACLYRHEQQYDDLARLISDLAPHLADPVTGRAASPDLEAPWSFLISYQIQVAVAARRWPDAQRLQSTRLAYSTRIAGDLDEPGAVRSLAVDEYGLGDILRQQGDPGCVAHLERAADLLRRIEARPEEATVCDSLSVAYADLPELRDLDRAEYWCRRFLDLIDGDSPFDRGRGALQLGNLAFERFGESGDVGELRTAGDAYREALTLLPDTEGAARSVAHNQLGRLCHRNGDVDGALHHYQESIGYDESKGDRYGAGVSRYNVAILLADARRHDEALRYAEAALDDFAAYGANAAPAVQEVRSLIAEIS
jgi:tetratricopeptide (TPR) repeat protein